MSLPPLSSATARLLTTLSVGVMALLLVLLVVDPFRVVATPSSPKRNLHLWVDGSLSMRGQAAAVADFIGRVKKLRHLEVQVHLLTPEVAPAPDQDLRSAMVGQVSGGWGAARAVRRSSADEAHALLSDFRWVPGDGSGTGVPGLIRVSFTGPDPVAGIHLEHPLSHIPLLAGEETRVAVRARWPKGATLVLRHGLSTAGHPLSSAVKLAERRTSLEGDDATPPALAFTPGGEGFYYVDGVVEGAGGQMARDHLVFQVAPTGLTVEMIFGQADYSARDLADLLGGYGGFNIRRHSLLRPGTEDEIRARLVEEQIDPGALWVLFAPSPELVKVAMARARGLLWFPMGRPQSVAALWPKAKVGPAGTLVFTTGPFRGPGEANPATGDVVTKVSMPRDFFDETWEGQGDSASVGRKGNVVLSGLSPMPRLTGDGLARALRAMVLSLHGRIGQKAGTLTRLGLGEWPTNWKAEDYRRLDFGKGPILPSAYRPDDHLMPLIDKGGLFWGDGKDGAPSLASWRLPLAEDPAFTVPLGIGEGPDEGFRLIEKENRPAPPKVFRERRALAGPWVAIPFFLALLVFAWARYAPRRGRGES